MIEFANWEAPQFLMLFILVLAVVGRFVMAGKPVTKTVRVNDGTEVHDHTGVVYGAVTMLIILAWGGFFA